MDRAHRRGAAWLFSVASAVYLADRVTKVWAEARLPGHPIDVIPGVLGFRFATNPGGAFSLGQDLPLFFAVVTVSVCVLIVARKDAGHVVDFIDPQIWPVFNLADRAIVIGAVLLAFGSFAGDRRAERLGSAIDEH